jgi:hypothetical protein
MVDAQLTNVRVLKPFEGFEARYQGRQALTPIAFPGERDPRARAQSAGFDPDLLAGIPVPEGARVILWLPICFSPVPPGNALFPFQFYSYRLIWRYQNLGGFRDPAVKHKRAPYHFPRQTPGAPDTSSGPALPRSTLPASWHVIAYEQTEPATGAGNLVIRVEQITPTMDPATLGADSGAASMPIFMPFWTDAEGDELIILATRTNATTDPADVWDFTSPDLDLAFSNIYGTGNGTHPLLRDLGIYMQTGTTP